MTIFPCVCVCYMKYLKEEQSVRERIQAMYCPGAESPFWEGIRTGVELMMDRSIIPSKPHSVEELARVSMISIGNMFGSAAGVQTMYFYGALMSHSCAPSCGWGVCVNAKPQQSSGEHPLEVRALRHIEVGEELTISYLSDHLWRPLRVRRSQLLSTKFFVCSCKRCSEPDRTEGFRCMECQSGTIFLQDKGRQHCDNAACSRHQWDSDDESDADKAKVLQELHKKSKWAEGEVDNLMAAFQSNTLVGNRKRLLVVHGICTTVMTQHWCLLAEVTDVSMDCIRPRLNLRDRDGSKFRIHIHIRDRFATFQFGAPQE